MKENENKMKEITYIDLFSGIGGFRKGLEPYNLKCLAYCDIDKYARQSYQAIFDTEGETVFEDIKDMDEHNLAHLVGKVDLICGGFPCQSFSTAGLKEGFNSKKSGDLFFQILRVAEIVKPKMLFLENVKNLISHDDGKTMDVILRLLYENGYDVQYEVLNSLNFGVPQNRERVFIIAQKRNWKPITKPLEITKFGKPNNSYRNYQTDEKGYITKKEGKKLTNTLKFCRKGVMINGEIYTENPEIIKTKLGIKTIIQSENEIDQKYYMNDDFIRKQLEHSELYLLDKPIDKLKKILEEDKEVYIVAPQMTRSTRRRLDNNYKRKYNQFNNHYSSTLLRKKDVGIVVSKPNRLFPIFNEDGKVNIENMMKSFSFRVLTPLECWRLQGRTDEDFYKAKEVVSEMQLYYQAGNSVTVNVIEHLGKEIQSLFNED